MDHLCYLCLVFVMLSRLFIAALWSPAGKGLTSWLLFVMFNCDFVTFPCGILGQVLYLIVSIPDLCRLSFLELLELLCFSVVQQCSWCCQEEAVCVFCRLLIVFAKSLDPGQDRQNVGSDLNLNGLTSDSVCDSVPERFFRKS